MSEGYKRCTFLKSRSSKMQESVYWGMIDAVAGQNKY